MWLPWPGNEDAGDWTVAGHHVYSGEAGAADLARLLQAGGSGFSGFRFEVDESRIGESVVAEIRTGPMRFERARLPGKAEYVHFVAAREGSVEFEASPTARVRVIPDRFGVFGGGAPYHISCGEGASLLAVSVPGAPLDARLAGEPVEVLQGGRGAQLLAPALDFFIELRDRRGQLPSRGEMKAADDLLCGMVAALVAEAREGTRTLTPGSAGPFL
ncbi:hypothetical protein [Leucobacter sp. wl10]|uniref:AraC-like ligand-binding domain-containing protein n=1 Tax=Leucobacter sp. wl10 TaxID=2304677 RepID=UPI000E5BD725|nr:hypothetical protein [Leucobacter sp. wl10]RGE19803.1 hypothetical protein D1J51_10560 [Leucobacter sp. wl10]